jgi:cytolysin-activating lysine-acyltransferase
MTLTDTTGRTLPPSEVPSPDALRLYGDVLFVAFRSPRHAGVPLAQVRAAFEPPLGSIRNHLLCDAPPGICPRL